MRVIISAECDTLTVEQNQERTNTLRTILRGLNGFGANFTFAEAEKVEKGVGKSSFIVNAKGLKGLRELVILAKWFNQESVIVSYSKALTEGEIVYISDDRDSTPLNFFHGKFAEDYIKVNGIFFTAFPKPSRTKASYTVPYAVA